MFSQDSTASPETLISFNSSLQHSLLFSAPKRIWSGLVLQSLHSNRNLWVRGLESIFSFYCQHRSWLRIVFLFHLLFTGSDKGHTLREAFWLPNVMNLISTVIFFAIVIYLQGFRIEIPVKNNRFHGQRGSYPRMAFEGIIRGPFTDVSTFGGCFQDQMLHATAGESVSMAFDLWTWKGPAEQ